MKEWEHIAEFDYWITDNRQVSKSTHHYQVRIRPNNIGGYYLVDFDVVMPHKNGLRNFKYDFSHLPQERLTPEVQKDLEGRLMAKIIWKLNDTHYLGTMSSFEEGEYSDMEALKKADWNWEWEWRPETDYLEDYVAPPTSWDVLRSYCE